MNFLDLECTGRPGILKLKHDDKLILVAAVDKKGKHPYVCKCECEAAEIVLSIGARIAYEMTQGRLPDFVPDLDDFVFCYVDQEPKDIPVTSLDEANSAIAAIKKL